MNLGKTKNFIGLTLANKKRFSVWIKKKMYNLIIINTNLLLNRNRSMNKETKLVLIII